MSEFLRSRSIEKVCIHSSLSIVSTPALSGPSNLNTGGPFCALLVIKLSGGVGMQLPGAPLQQTSIVPVLTSVLRE